MRAESKKLTSTCDAVLYLTKKEGLLLGSGAIDLGLTRKEIVKWLDANGYKGLYSRKKTQARYNERNDRESIEMVFYSQNLAKQVLRTIPLGELFVTQTNTDR